MDGEEGFSARLTKGGLVLSRGEMKVELERGEGLSAAWDRRYRYGRSLLVMGLVLLVALGIGAILLALYYFSKDEVLVLSHGEREYVLSGRREELARLHRFLTKKRRGKGSVCRTGMVGSQK